MRPPVQKFASPDPDLVARTFDYDTMTGALIWKWRPRDMFKSDLAWTGINKRYTGKRAGHTHTCTVGKKYVQVWFCGRLHYAHRIVWVMHNGPIPDGMQIDHVDGDGTNNRIENLRLVTPTENKRNMRKPKTNTSGYVGVTYDKRAKRYVAMVGHKDGTTYLGQAGTAEGAFALRQAYNAANGFHPNHGTDRPL
jgi:hypothetical protein